MSRPTHEWGTLIFGTCKKWSAKQRPPGSKTNLQANLTEIAGFITQPICMDQAGAMVGTACRRRLGDPSFGSFASGQIHGT